MKNLCMTDLMNRGISCSATLLKSANAPYWPLLLFPAIVLLLAGCKNEKAAVPVADYYYTCSMDPQVIENDPGKCPVCHMELTKVFKTTTTANGNEIKLSEQQIQLGNITTDTIRHAMVGDKIILTATLNFDQLHITTIGARVNGRIEKLYHQLSGEYITANSPLFDIYSEELNNAKQEYIAALKNETTLNNAGIDFGRLIESARQKLIYWGMNTAQINELTATGKTGSATTFYSNASGYITELTAKEGDYIMEGATVIKLADLSTLWVEAQVYASQLSMIDAGSMATVQFPDLSGKEIQGRIAFVNPEINPDTRINLIRVTIPNINNQLKPGMPAYVLLNGHSKNALTLPSDAVIRNGNTASVWVKTGPQTFSSRMVVTGLETENSIEIQSGLKPGDVVVISGAYLLNSEYIFKKGSNPMAGHDMSTM